MDRSGGGSESPSQSAGIACANDHNGNSQVVGDRLDEIQRQTLLARTAGEKLMNLIDDQDLSVNESKRAQGGMLKCIDPPIGVVRSPDRIENAQRSGVRQGRAAFAK